jgi:hypothetical protein
VGFTHLLFFKGGEHMKVKVLVDCIGIGYDLKAGDIVELDEKIAKKLIKFQYVEKIKEGQPPKKKKKGGE